MTRFPTRHLRLTTVLLTVLSLGEATPGQGIPASPHVRRLHHVVCVGDSITFGSRLADREHDAWPAILAELLGSDYQVLNAGVSGATLLKQGNLPIWKTRVFDEALGSRPDAVFLFLGTNDTKRINWEHKAALASDLRDLVRRFRGLASKPRILICLPPPAWTHGDGIDRARLAEGVVPLFARVAREEHCELLDFHTPLESHSAWFPDGVHPNPFGAEFLARHAYRALKRPAGATINFATIPCPSVEFRGKSAGWGGGNWRAEFERVRSLAANHPELDLIFFGDSITQGLSEANDRLAHAGGKRRFDRDYGRYRAANFGISGDRTEHLLYRIAHGNLHGLHAKVIVLMIGVNNLGQRHNTGHEVAVGTAAVVAALRREQPAAKILLLGCFPSGDAPDCWRRRQIDILHQEIEMLADDPNVVYLDLRRVFLHPDGRIQKRRMRLDLVHLSGAGYASWARAMQPRVRELMGEELQQEQQPAWLTRTVAVRPSERQIAWQRREFTGFLHFGINTFTDREWGTGKEDPKLFQPTALDTDQWVRVAKDAGMKMLILTAKHHDGFCLWPSRYTTHSVASSPWMHGTGDVVKLLAASCHKLGMKLGVYLSPADLYQIESSTGLYGNGSRYTERTIPRPVPGRPFADQRSFRYRVDDYNEYYMNQLFELLTEYGPIHEVWLDGANPKPKGNQTYTYQQWYDLIRKLAPQAMIFGKGPDCRWIGNERGGAREAEWSVIPLPVPVKECTWSDLTAKDLGSRARIRDAKFLHWYPAEMDTSIRPGWFYHAKQDGDPRASLRRLDDLYMHGVGGNAVLLLNVPPDRRGLIAEFDARRLREFGAHIRRCFAHNLARGARASARHTTAAHAAANAIDGKLDTFWMPEAGINRSSLTLHLERRQAINLIALQEQIRLGQRIERFLVEGWTGHGWAHLAAGTTIGHKRLLRFPEVRVDRVRVRILSSRAEPTLSEIGLFLAPDA